MSERTAVSEGPPFSAGVGGTSGGAIGGFGVVSGPRSSSFLPARGVVIPDAVCTKCFVSESGNCFGGRSLTRSVGSKRRLWGGNGPQSSCVWCARALVMPNAQSSQCWPFGFGRDCHFGGEYYSGGDFLFWKRGSGTIGGQQLRANNGRSLLLCCVAVTPCSCLTWPPRSYVHNKNKRSIHSKVYLMAPPCRPSH